MHCMCMVTGGKQAGRRGGVDTVSDRQITHYKQTQDRWLAACFYFFLIGDARTVTQLTLDGAGSLWFEGKLFLS